MQTSNYSALLASYQQPAAEAFKRGQLAKASKVLREALREAEEVGQLHDGLVTSATEVAEILQSQQKFSEAETLYRAVLELREKMLGSNHPAVIESLQRLAMLQIVSFRAEALGKNFVAAAS